MESKPNDAGSSLPRAACSAAVDHLDLMRDEFMRIRACPGANEEIKGLCDRAISGVERRVPLIVEHDKLLAARARATHEAIMRICPDCGDDMCGDEHRTCFRCAAQAAHDRLCRFTHEPLTQLQRDEINSIINGLKTALRGSSAVAQPNTKHEVRDE